MSLYAIRELTLVREGGTILDIPDLEIAKGRVCALLGPNGAGKSSLLSLLAFLDRPTAGEIRFHEEPAPRDPDGSRRFRLRVSLVDQRPVLFTASVADNVAFGLKVRGVPGNRRRVRIMEALDVVGMSDFAKRRATSLSGGEMQRVAIARAIACRPEVLLLDEPTANVDAVHQILIEDIIRRIGGLPDMSILLATHNLAQAYRLSGRRIHLLDGRLSSRSEDNVFPASLALGNERFSALIPAAFSGNPAAAKGRFLRVRSDALELLPAGPPTREPFSGAGLVEATLVEISLEDGHVRLSLDAGLPLTLRLSRSILENHRLTVGDRPWIVCPPSAVSWEPFRDNPISL